MKNNNMLLCFKRLSSLKFKHFSAHFMQGPIPPAIPIVNLAPASFVPFHTCCCSCSLWWWAPGLARPSKLHCFRTAAHPRLFCALLILAWLSWYFRSQSFSTMLSTVLLILVGISPFTDSQSPAACNCFDCKVGFTFNFLDYFLFVCLFVCLFV